MFFCDIILIMENEDVTGKFYDICEGDEEVVFRIYGRNEEELATFRCMSKFKNVGVKMIWLFAGALSPLYLLVLLFEVMIVALFVLLMTLAIVSGTEIYLVIAMGFVFSFVFTVGIGRLIRVIDPKISSDDLAKSRC